MDILTDSRLVSRLEIVETGRRRRWSDAEKLRIVEESFSGPRLASATATFVQNNAYRFVTKVKTDDMAVIAIRNAGQGRTGQFGSWLEKGAQAEMLSLGVVEIEMQDAGPRWSDEAIGFGLTFADIAFGRFDKIENAEDRTDAIAVFERPVQLFIARWLRAQAQTFGDALKKATGEI